MTAPNCALTALAHWATVKPEAVAVHHHAGRLSYADLSALVMAASRALAGTGDRLALLLDNGAGWIVADLAARQVSAVIVPVPGYFTDAQLRHVIDTAGIDLIVTDQPERVEQALADCLPGRLGRLAAGEVLDSIELVALDGISRHAAPKLPGKTRKVTFTSGTTGMAKGVCLSDDLIDNVARSLAKASGGTAADRHLQLLPLAALLENIAGIDVPLLLGAEICSLPLQSVGLGGSSSLDMSILVAALDRHRPTSIVTVPQSLNALVHAARTAKWRPSYLRHVAVGGATLPRGAIAAARALGLPVFEGYGLSECGSVVALNTLEADHPGSVGKPLPHCRVSLAADGEVLVWGAGCEGFLCADTMAPMDDPMPTGDIGRLDEDGFLYLLGRKKNIFITSFGRNVEAEWIECELSATPSISQAAVFGEARPWNVAVVVPRTKAKDWQATVSGDIARVNEGLPDYARIRRWLTADRPFLPDDGLLTWNGRLRRPEIFAVYSDRIERLYDEEERHVS